MVGMLRLLISVKKLVAALRGRDFYEARLEVEQLGQGHHGHYLDALLQAGVDALLALSLIHI